MIYSSAYAAHLGSHTDFEAKMSLLTDPYERLDERLIFLTDGAPWIAHWVKAEYPKSTLILDVFHAKEHLSTFLQAYYGQQDHQQRYGQWSAHLIEAGGQALIERLQALPPGNKTVKVLLYGV